MIAWLITGILTGTTMQVALATRRRRKVWRTVFDYRTLEGHVLPLNDIVDHPEDDECVCGPRGEALQRDDGSYAWLYVHHSLDGRERREPGGSVAQ